MSLKGMGGLNKKNKQRPGESTEKRSILYVSAKIQLQQSRIMCDWLEKLEATEINAMFGDDDINFDMQLERFDVDTNQQLRTFFGHGSKNRRRKPERRLIVLRRHVCLQSIKDLFSMIWTQGVHRNMEFRRGRGNGWFVVGVSADKPDDESCNEPFSLEMACELIGATKQKEGVKVLQLVVEELE